MIARLRGSLPFPKVPGWQGALFLIEELDISRPTLKCKLYGILLHVISRR